MLALLLCLISLTRSTFGYFSSKLIGTMERGSPSISYDKTQEAHGDVFPSESESESDDDKDDGIQGGDRDILEDGDDSDTPGNRIKRKANSVVDSVGINGDFTLSEYYTPRRTRSQPTEEASPEEDYSISPDPPGWRRNAIDAVDAHMEKAARDDDQSGSGATPTVVVKIPVEKDAARYKMDHKNRGKCVVFNHETFETGSANRTGSTADASRIEKTFKNLGFDVDICDDFTHNEVMTKITELSEEDHSDNDCICVFVLTHGLNNDLISAKDVFYKSDNIWKPFTADNSTTLAGKPKLFFFQACRGDQFDSGVQVFRFDRTETDSSATSYKLPTHADFLIAHSTAQGFFSWRNPEDGTWYVQCLCDTLDEYWRTTDLLSMLTITSRKVATEYASYHDVDAAKDDQKQVPSVTSMLIRDIYFESKERQRDE